MVAARHVPLPWQIPVLQGSLLTGPRELNSHVTYVVFDAAVVHGWVKAEGQIINAEEENANVKKRFISAALVRQLRAFIYPGLMSLLMSARSSSWTML